jgi:hypothetical protein
MLQAFLVLILMLLHSPQTTSQDVQPPPQQKADEEVLRDPFTLKLKLPGGGNYEERFDQTPYVKDGSIYIFPGENFGVNAQLERERIISLAYVKNPAKADVRLKLTEQGGGKGVMMLLVIESKLKQTLYLDAAMKIPNREGAYKTSILPVLAGKGGFESWPHPISLLILRNLRFTK